jgi:hypothetical protein
MKNEISIYTKNKIRPNLKKLMEVLGEQAARLFARLFFRFFFPDFLGPLAV